MVMALELYYRHSVRTLCGDCKIFKTVVRGKDGLQRTLLSVEYQTIRSYCTHSFPGK